MSELQFSLLDIIMFMLSGMALGFVLGCVLMQKIHKAMSPPPDRLDVLMELGRISRSPEDEAESFHEECGDR